MSDYISDPDLLAKLNGTAPAAESSTAAPEASYITDAALIDQLNSTSPTVGSQMYTAPATGVDNMLVAGAGTVPALAQAYWEGPARAGVRDMTQVASMMSQATPEVMAQLAKNPIELAKAFVQGHPWYNAAKNIPGIPGKVAGFAGRAAAAALTGPENLVMLPYNMAAYEQEKIRANPTAPGLQYNPYAQTVRGEYPTQGAAGAANQRRAVADMPYGNVSADERKMLDTDRQLSMAMRLKAAKKVLGQP